jgi:glyoxylase-like metal-dependent hydrolase (beta-lactamase superfamily II)
MKTVCIFGKNYDSNIYLILGEKPTIIDCGTGFNFLDVNKEIKKIIEPTSIKQIILTHEHFDHCGGIKNIYDSTKGNVKILSHQYAAKKIEKGESMFAKMLGGTMYNMPVDIKLNDGDNIKIGNEKFQVLHTPGHSQGSISLYSKSSKSLFSGDTIFSNGSFGRYDFPGGDFGLIKNSIRRLANLDVRNLYPGHELFIEENGNVHMNMALNNISMIG